MARHYGAQWIAVIGRQILPVHLVGDQHVGLHPFGIADRAELPLCARHRRHHEYAAVAGAFQCGDVGP